MGDSSKVDIHALAKFGTDTADSLKAYTNGLGAPYGKIGKGSMGGASLGTNEAQTFHDWYTEGVNASVGNFMNDSPLGLMALGFGAIVMAGNYAAGDQSQAQAMDDVITMFSLGPNKGLEADMAKNNKGVKDKTTVKPLPAPNTPDDIPPPTNVCLPNQELTPMQQLKLHNDQYGQWETWRPNQHPNPTPEPSPTPTPTPAPTSAPPSSAPPSTPSPEPAPPVPEPTPTTTSAPPEARPTPTSTPQP